MFQLILGLSRDNLAFLRRVSRLLFVLLLFVLGGVFILVKTSAQKLNNLNLIEEDQAWEESVAAKKELSDARDWIKDSDKESPVSGCAIWQGIDACFFLFEGALYEGVFQE